MSRKPRQYEKNLTPAQKELAMFNYQQLQRACIVRGMHFDALVKGNLYSLQAYFEKHFYDKVDNSLLDKFDEWREEVMRRRGTDEPFVRLGFIGEKDPSTGEVLSIKKPKKFKKPKNTKKREKDGDFGIWLGTKKALTAECLKKGYDLEKTIQKVKDAFPDAKEKSINIWYKRFKKAHEKV